MIDFDTPRLIADIGGTYARFALETAPGRFEQLASLRSAEHADFRSAVLAYLSSLPPATRIEHAAVAIANPVSGDVVRMVNYHWQFSIEQTREQLGFQTLVVVNDFTALAMAVPRLQEEERRQVGAGAPAEGNVIGVIGPGTGLGVSGLIPVNDGWVALGAEGGHASLAPRDERELAILQFAWKELGHGHVSFERLLSGPGLELIHRALCAYRGAPADPLPAPEITRRALAGEEPLCSETIDVFCAVLGTAAGDLAMTLGAQGGIYIGGGIVPRLGRLFDTSAFRQRFEDKGRLSDFVKNIPTFVITAENATFIGASAILEAQLRSMRDSGTSSPILAQIRRGLDSLSPAERRVADHVLSQPRTVLNEPIAEIAKAAQVSQPTVIRFCRSLGCEGLSDFKLRLASGLTGTKPVTHAQVTREDSLPELGAKVLDNTASAILQVRDHLNRDTLGRAIELLNGARHIELHASGQYGIVAQDAQFKFLRFGIQSAAYSEPRLQTLAANTLAPNDVVVIISSSGRVPELLSVADIAHSRGAHVIAITASQSPLVRKANVALIVDHEEDADTQLPMVSRILHLLIIDILAVGLAMRRSGAGEAAAPVTGRKRRAVPGVSASLSPANLTSHSR
jgi:glucokinase